MISMYSQADWTSVDLRSQLDLDRFQNGIHLVLALRGLSWICQYSASNDSLSNLERYLINLQCYLDAC